MLPSSPGNTGLLETGRERERREGQEELQRRVTDIEEKDRVELSSTSANQGEISAVNDVEEREPSRVPGSNLQGEVHTTEKRAGGSGVLDAWQRWGEGEVRDAYSGKELKEFVEKHPRQRETRQTTTFQVLGESSAKNTMTDIDI